VPDQRVSESGGRRRIFSGRTGIGRVVAVDESEDWVDFRYTDRDGNEQGFSLNPLYATRLTMTLVEVLARRHLEGSGGAR
jgi:hypothetical protein